MQKNFITNYYTTHPLQFLSVFNSLFQFFGVSTDSLVCLLHIIFFFSLKKGKNSTPARACNLYAKKCVGVRLFGVPLASVIFVPCSCSRLFFLWPALLFLFGLLCLCFIYTGPPTLENLKKSMLISDLLYQRV